MAFFADILSRSDNDMCLWKLRPTNVFGMSCTGQYNDELTLSEGSNHTCWIRFVPIKFNVLLWTWIHNKIPTRTNLEKIVRNITFTLRPTLDKRN